MGLELGAPTEPVILREPFLEHFYGYGSVDGGGAFTDNVYLQTCSVRAGPATTPRTNLGGGDRLRIEYRHRLSFAGTGP